MSASTRICPIWEDKSLLFANNISVKARRRSDVLLRVTNRNPLAEFSICYRICLFRFVISFFVSLIAWAVTERLYAASGWYTNTIYVPLARWVMYWSLIERSWRIVPLILVVVVLFSLIVLRFLHCRTCISVIPVLLTWIILLLNFRSWSVINCSRSLTKNPAFSRPSYSFIAKSSSPTNRVLSVWRLMTPNGWLLYRRQGS